MKDPVLCEIGQRLADARANLLNEPAIVKTEIQEKWYKAVITSRGIWLQVLAERMDHSSEMTVIARKIVADLVDYKFEFELVIFSPSYNLPNPFKPYHQAFETSAGSETNLLSYWMRILIVERR